MTYIHLSSTCIKITQWPKIKHSIYKSSYVSECLCIARALTHKKALCIFSIFHEKLKSLPLKYFHEIPCEPALNVILATVRK